VLAGLASADILNSGFSAFISYSHADAAMAAALQKKLERYRLPRKIAAAYHIGNTALGKIFRDQEDLAAAPSVSDAIRDGLARSQALIVICSPAAAASQWVKQEIELFRSLHADRPILAVLVHGEPATAFPAALTQGGIEPLAADMREGGDGAQLAFLKIVAGIAGIPLDALIQRDAQRKLRRVTAITLGALAAMLIMAVMTSLALNARNEAARQRAEAEGLVEYMLTDLRDKLEGVGRLDVQGKVNLRAMEYYKQQGKLKALPADSLERRARVLHAMGEDYEKQGELPKAIAKFREAHSATDALLEREPKNPDRIFAHAQSEYYIGLAAWRQLDRATTARHWQNYRNMAGQLAAIEPETVRSNMELGYSEGGLCELGFRDNFDLASAAKHCQAAVDFETAAVNKQPANRHLKQELSNRYGWLANVEKARGHYQEAIKQREKDAALLDTLLKFDGNNTEYLLRRTWADIGMAEAQIFEGKPSEAMQLLRRAAIRHSALTAHNDSDRRVAETALRIPLLLAKAEQKAGLSYAHNLAEASRLSDMMKQKNPLIAASVKSIWASIWPN
jgi:hypothetical protein